MPINSQILIELHALMNAPAPSSALATFLVANSSLPGSRANLELIYAVADASAGRQDLVPLYIEWLDLSTTKEDPAEFLSAVAAVALGAIFPNADEPNKLRVTALLRKAANDSRWRVREGVAMGLQRIGEANFAALDRILRNWLPNATFLEQRAIMAALAHPPILNRSDVAGTSLEIAETISTNLTKTNSSDRKTKEFKTLKQGLSYALSVFVAASPVRGFALLRGLVATRDKDALAIVNANLGKNRIARPFPEEVATLLREITPV